MKKHTLGRAAGFVAAIGATTALVAGGVSMTGAYFQDEERGDIAATMGEVDVSVNENTPLTSSFGPLMPGDNAGDTNTYQFKNVGTDKVDLWLASENWSINAAPVAGKPDQAAGSSISESGVIRLSMPEAAGGGTSYEWEGVTTQITDGETISFEWSDGAGNSCLGGGVPRMFVQGGVYNTWDADPASPASCGTAVDANWHKVTGTLAGVTSGAAGHVGVVNDAGNRVIHFRNVTIGQTSLTSPNLVGICTTPSHNALQVRVNSTTHDTGFDPLCALPTGDDAILVAEDVSVGEARNINVTLRLTSAAGNDLANRLGTAELVVIATQPNTGQPTDQADQVGNDAA